MARVTRVNSLPLEVVLHLLQCLSSVQVGVQMCGRGLQMNVPLACASSVFSAQHSVTDAHERQASGLYGDGAIGDGGGGGRSDKFTRGIRLRQIALL